VEVSVSGQGAGQNDPVVSMRSAIKSDGTNVYEYVLSYTNDALSIGVEAGLIFGTRLACGSITTLRSSVTQATQ
jgi:hypothetical protein